MIFIFSVSFVSAEDIDINSTELINESEEIVYNININDSDAYIDDVNQNLSQKNDSYDYNLSENNIFVDCTEGNISLLWVSPTEGFILEGIFDCADRVRNFIEENGVCPNYVIYISEGGVSNYLTMPDYLFLICKAIVMTYEGNNSNIMHYDFHSANINPSSPFGDSINGRIYAEDFYVYAKNVVNWYTENGLRAPNYVSTDLGKMQYQTAIYMFSRIGQYIYLNGDMPNYVTVSVPISHSMNQYLPDFHPTEL